LQPPTIDTHDDQTALLFFSHRPEREWQNKWFVRQDIAKTRRAAAAFYKHTRQAVDDSGLPVLEVNGAQQRGDDFGTRLANAVADAFAQGYERVIAVGSDCPTLHEVDWQAVDDTLADGPPVLGPTADGEGTYLIGLRRSQFDKEAFATLPWQSPTLLSALTRHLSVRAGTAPTVLAPRADVNGPAELAALLKAPGGAPHGLVAQLRSVLGPRTHRRCRDRTATDASRRGQRSRAPPLSPTSGRSVVAHT
jgi:glycosyltransferase A (GT-A) superfamily protein (DUF2064 family)